METALVSAIGLYTQCKIDTDNSKDHVELALENERFTWALEELVLQDGKPDLLPLRSGAMDLFWAHVNDLTFGDTLLFLIKRDGCLLKR